MAFAQNHIAKQYSFDVLADGLEQNVALGFINKKTAPDAPHLATYCYTDRCTFERAWNDFTMAARGIVLDHDAGVVRALPFPKFFNHGENSAHVLPNLPFEAQEKLDGSLGIVFHDGARWRVNTKGSFISEQAQWAQERLGAFSDMLTVGTTYLFEIIYAANRIVVPYDYEGLVLLSAYDADGMEYERPQLEHLADVIGVRICEVTQFASFEEMFAAAQGFSSDKEGFVVRFSNGYRVKVKGAEYLRVHKLISRVTPIAIWECMHAGDDLDAMRMQIPEEFWGDFDSIRTLLAEDLSNTIHHAEDGARRMDGLDDKEAGLRRSELTGVAHRFLFSVRRYGYGSWVERLNQVGRLNLFGEFRPKANVLEGYSPSRSVQRVQEESK